MTRERTVSKVGSGGGDANNYKITTVAALKIPKPPENSSFPMGGVLIVGPLSVELSVSSSLMLLVV